MVAPLGRLLTGSVSFFRPTSSQSLIFFIFSRTIVVGAVVCTVWWLKGRVTGSGASAVKGGSVGGSAEITGANVPARVSTGGADSLIVKAQASWDALTAYIANPHEPATQEAFKQLLLLNPKPAYLPCSLDEKDAVLKNMWALLLFTPGEDYGKGCAGRCYLDLELAAVDFIGDPQYQLAQELIKNLTPEERGVCLYMTMHCREANRTVNTLLKYLCLFEKYSVSLDTENAKICWIKMKHPSIGDKLLKILGKGACLPALMAIMTFKDTYNLFEHASKLDILSWFMENGANPSKEERRQILSKLEELHGVESNIVTQLRPTLLPDLAQQEKGSFSGRQRNA